jgi:RimJ/RimL family protein N-acetyltransferase
MDQEEPRPILNIFGEKVALGPITREHLHQALKWINDFETIRTLGAPPRPMTFEQELDWYEGIRKSDTDVVFAIYDLGSMRVVGSAGLHRINWRHRTADFGIMIGEQEFRGRGLGTETTSLVLVYAFRQLGLNNVFLQVVEINDAGIRAYERAGFREIGRRRKAWFVEGKYYDMVFMDCLADDFEPR